LQPYADAGCCIDISHYYIAITDYAAIIDSCIGEAGYATPLRHIGRRRQPPLLIAFQLAMSRFHKYDAAEYAIEYAFIAIAITDFHYFHCNRYAE
jgi:hypothetical protein